MKGFAVINTNTVRAIERLTMAVGGISLVAAVFYIGRSTLTYYDHKRTLGELTTVNQKLEQMTQTLEKAKRIRYRATSVKELSLVQTALERLAIDSNCQLLEVNSNNDEAPYLSHYKKTTEVTGWKQTVITCQAIGTIGNVMGLVKKVTNLSVPVELQAMDVMPMGKVQDGRPVVTAKFAIQVMKREVKA